LFELWRERKQSDEYLGTLVNEYLARGGRAAAVRAGERYVDVGTLNGYRQAIQLLAASGNGDGELLKSLESNQPRFRPPEIAKRAEAIFSGKTV